MEQDWGDILAAAGSEAVGERHWKKQDKMGERVGKQQAQKQWERDIGTTGGQNVPTHRILIAPGTK
jgi:hypothetical protein